MTPAEWNSAMAPEQPWQKAYATVEAEARRHLSALGDAVFINTNELVEDLYPAKFALGPGGMAARGRIIKALLATMRNSGEPAFLADCRERGAPVLNHWGKKVEPWQWHRPEAKRRPAPAMTCPHCGGQVF